MNDALHGTWRRGGPLTTVLAWIQGRPGHIYRYAIDWDVGEVRIAEQRLLLSEASGVWLTKFYGFNPRSGIEITYPGMLLKFVFQGSWTRGEPLAEAIAARCGCLLHRTNC